MSLGFIVMVTPWTIQEVVAACTGSKPPPFLDFLATWLALSNSFWNPFLYWLLNNHFRRISRELLYTKVRVNADNFTFAIQWFSRFISTIGRDASLEINTRTRTPATRRIELTRLHHLLSAFFSRKALLSSVEIIFSIQSYGITENYIARYS